MRTWKPPANLVTPGASAGREIGITCRFIAPVFGGGVDPKQPDPVTPVRVPSIRGQLRFWWRATHADLSLSELRRREELIFGGVHGDKPTPSAVAVTVTKQPSRPRRLEVFVRGNAFELVHKSLTALAYGAFPLRGSAPERAHDALFIYEAPFEISLRFRPVAGLQVEDEVRRALWAWLHFGGLGGRTRRGFGALELVSARGWELPSIEAGWPTERRRDEVEWPVLPRSAGEVGRAPRKLANGRDAQERLLDLLRRMRQGDLGRKPNQPRPGRSYWPEPDALRKVHGITSGRHSTPIHSPRIDKFPRAAFGTPIIFQFKTEPGEREPLDTTLVPTARVEGKVTPLHRLASSLVLRPHAVGDGAYEAMAVRLVHPAPHGWGLLEKLEKNNLKARVQASLDPAEAQRITPLQAGGRSHPDPVAAYLALLPTI